MAKFIDDNGKEFYCDVLSLDLNNPYTQFTIQVYGLNNKTIKEFLKKESRKRKFFRNG